MAVPLQNPSGVVVSGPESFARNFAENAQNVVCQGAFGAGAYAIGSQLLGAPTPKPPQALLVGGALVAAMSLCPSRPTQEGIFGSSPPWSGGQCPVDYDFTWDNYWRPNQGLPVGLASTGKERVFGPVRQAELVYRDMGSRGKNVFLLVVDRLRTSPTELNLGFTDADTTQQDFRVVRVDGLPDNCGNPPTSGGSVITNNIEGDTINNENVIDNSNQTYIVPITFALSNFSGTINLPFSNVRIDSFLPLSFDLNAGGIRFGFGQGPDGVLRPKEVIPDLTEPANDRELLRQIQQVLKEVRECVCKPEVDMDLLFMPTLQDESSCLIQTESLLVPRGSISETLFDKFVRTAVLAQEACSKKTPEQVPQELIYAASTTMDGRELFTPKFGPEVVSLFLKITDVRPEGPRKIELYPASNQRKFGSVSFVLTTIAGGGDSIYVFDVETYIPVPRHAKDGRLRLLLKKGLSFEVYDTGERL